MTLFEKWFEYGTYYAHGPFAVLVFLWVFRKRLQLHPPEPEKTSYAVGAGLAGIAMLLNLFGLKYGINFCQTSSVYIFFVANCWFFFGRQALIKNWDLFLYLLLAVPLPYIWLSSITFKLKLLSSYLAGGVLSLVYPSTVRYGNILELEGQTIAVTPACSGLQNILAMFFLVFLLAFFQRKRHIALIDFAVALPAAILANVIRIVVVCILVVSGYRQFALIDWHEEIGVAAFFLVFFLITLFNEISLKKYKTETKFPIYAFLTRRTRYVVHYILALLVIMGVAFFVSRPSTGTTPAPQVLVTKHIPADIGGWTSEDEVLESYYYRVLGTRDLLMRAYFEKDVGAAEKVYLYVIHTMDKVKVVHPPELCIEGEGYNLLKKADTTILGDSLNIPARRLLFQRGKKALLVYYWYRLEGRNTLDVFAPSLLSMPGVKSAAAGSSMIRLSIPGELKNIEEKEKILLRFAKDALPAILDSGI